RRAGEPRAEHAHRAARGRRRARGRGVLVARRDVLLVVAPPQDREHAHDGGEEDELLADGVEAAVVEVHRRDDVLRPPLRDRARDEEVAVGARARPRRRQRAEGGAEERRQPGDPDREEDGARSDAAASEPHVPVLGRAPARRCSSASRRTLASVSRIMSGRATAPTTTCDSATSGAWYRRKSSASTIPRKLTTIACASG